MVLDPASPHQTKKKQTKKKNVVKVGPPLTKLSGSAHFIATRDGEGGVRA